MVEDCRVAGGAKASVHQEMLRYKGSSAKRRFLHRKSVGVMERDANPLCSGLQRHDYDGRGAVDISFTKKCSFWTTLCGAVDGGVGVGSTLIFTNPIASPATTTNKFLQVLYTNNNTTLHSTAKCGPKTALFREKISTASRPS